MKNYQLSDFHYDLPDEQIARFPAAERTGSKLLVMNRQQHSLQDCLFKQLTEFVSPGDCLVFNESRVIAARLFGQKASGGKVEVLIERVLGKHEALAYVRSSKSPKPGSTLILNDSLTCEVIGREQECFHLRFHGDADLFSLLEQHGEVPLPPYFKRSPTEEDKARYQTVYAKDKGSVAAPTAGLHFDEALLAQLAHNGVEQGFLTLHVGAGTFAPVRTDDINEHHMHSEWFEVSESLCQKVEKTKAQGGRVIAVGTTSARALEAASTSGALEPYQGDTEIFITPGYTFNTIDGLITNFHLPESTLLMLVGALTGVDFMHAAYQHAIANAYRFYSYGDAMLII